MLAAFTAVVMRKTTKAPIFLASVLLLAALSSPVAASCKARLLVYLDVSGSMDTKGESGSRSPYLQTLDSIASLLADNDFFDEDDEVHFLPFGASVKSRNPALGPAEIGAELAALRATPPSDAVTIFEPVFADLLGRLGQESTADRTLVIIASDFVVEPESRFDLERGQRNWQDSWREYESALRTVFGETVAGAPFLSLFVVDVTGLGVPLKQELRNEVLNDLQSLGYETVARQTVGGATTSRALAQEIRKRFSRTPIVSASLIASGEYQIDVQNPGCLPVTIRDLRVLCPSRSEIDALAVPIGSVTTLAAFGTDGSTQRFTADVSSFPCPEEHVVEVSTNYGLIGSSSARTETRLEVRLMRAEVLAPQPPLGSFIEVHLELAGVASEQRVFPLRLRRQGTTTPVAEVAFILPPDMPTPDETPQAYRVVLPAVASVHDGERVDVAIDGSRMNDPRIAVTYSLWSLFGAWIPVLIVIGTCYALWDYFRGRKAKDPTVHLTTFDRVLAVLASTAPFILWLVGYLVVTRFFESVVPNQKTSLLLALASLGVWGWLYLARIKQNEDLVVLLREEDHVNFAEYERRVLHGSRTRGIVALVTLAIFVFLVFNVVLKNRNSLTTLETRPIAELAERR